MSDESSDLRPQSDDERISQGLAILQQVGNDVRKGDTVTAVILVRADGTAGIHSPLTLPDVRAFLLDIADSLGGNTRIFRMSYDDDNRDTPDA